MKVKRGDTVLIIAGKEKGKTGKIEKIGHDASLVTVEGANIYKRHTKPSRRNPHGGIMDIPRPLNASNVMVVCQHCSKASRIGIKETEKGKLRICRRCGESVDQE